MKKKILFVVIASLLGSVFGQEAKFSGELSTKWGVAAPGTSNAGDFTAGKTDFTASLDAYYGDGSLKAEGTAGYDIIAEKFFFDLSEAYVDYSSSNWGIRIGAQKVAWGKADGINITNAVFPSDSTSLYLEDNSVAINAVRLSFSGSSFTIDGYWIPFFTGNKLPLDEKNPLRKAVIPSSVTVNLMGTHMELPVKVGVLEKPDLNIKNGEYGLKASAYLSFCDLSLYGFYGWDKTPLINYEVSKTIHPVYGVEVPESITINGKYNRMAMAGVDAAFPVGETVIRLENAYFPERSFQASAESIMAGKESFVKQHQLMGLAGIDWMPSGWTITAQYYYDIIFNLSDNLERKDAFTHGATLSLSKTFLQETLELSLSGVVGLNNFDSAIEFNTNYSITDQLKLDAGCYVFLPGPEKEGTYGAFKDLSSIFIKCKYSF